MTEINELVIRIPAAEGRDNSSLGNEVAQRVSESLPEGMGTHYIPELKVRIPASQSPGTTDLSERIAEQIIQQIKLATV